MMPDFTPDIPPSADEAETLALAKHPSILAARLTLTAAEFQLIRTGQAKPNPDRTIDFINGYQRVF